MDICCIFAIQISFFFFLFNVCHEDSIVLASFDAPACVILAKRYYPVSNVNLVLYQNGIEKFGKYLQYCP